MVVDGAAALVGSSNVNRRSLDHDEEVAMVVIDAAWAPAKLTAGAPTGATSGVV
jgi:phosphatidylserine/phosphatidylglycerophosphate/cardiolipin synthase-like enzyme